ncbi:MAG: TVP38/TMEM64 family protein [Bacteroidota bacterium]
MKSKSLKIWIPPLIIILLIIVPFILFGHQIEAWTQNFIKNSSQGQLIVGLVLGLLLASDILVPVPSSLVSTASGYLLGFYGGTLSSFIGMTLSCFIGYWLGVYFGRNLIGRLIDMNDWERFDRFYARYGDWILITSRAVPVMAETSIFFAGINRMPLWYFSILTILANLGISVVYAIIGAFSFKTNSFLLAFFGAIILPGIMMLPLKRKTKSKEDYDRKDPD